MPRGRRSKMYMRYRSEHGKCVLCEFQRLRAPGYEGCYDIDFLKGRVCDFCLLTQNRMMDKRFPHDAFSGMDDESFNRVVSAYTETIWLEKLQRKLAREVSRYVANEVTDRSEK